MSEMKVASVPTRALPLAQYVAVAVLAALFGWIIGATGLITGDHWLLSLIAGLLAPASVLGFVALAAVWSFPSGPALFPRVGSGAGHERPQAGSAPSDEPSHIHVRRPSRGERA